MSLRKMRILWDICSYNTLYFNFKYLPFSKAIKLPIWVSRNLRIRMGGGVLIIDGDLRKGMIRIGLDNVGIFDNKKSRSIWSVSGTIIFRGNCFLGHGCKVSVDQGAILEFGNNFCCSAESSFVTVKNITIGNDCLFSWDVLVMDTDWHVITDYSGELQNPPESIKIGDRVWVGCRANIMKGVSIANGTIVAASSIISKDVVECNCIVGNKTQQIIRDGVLWHD